MQIELQSVSCWEILHYRTQRDQPVPKGFGEQTVDTSRNGLRAVPDLNMAIVSL
jgi:hypothetical protein